MSPEPEAPRINEVGAVGLRAHALMSFALTELAARNGGGLVDEELTVFMGLLRQNAPNAVVRPLATLRAATPVERVGTTAAARLLGVTPGRIRQLALKGAGCPIRGAKRPPTQIGHSPSMPSTNTSRTASVPLGQLAEQAEDAARAAHAAHARAAEDQERLETNGSDDPLEWARAHGRARQTAHELRKAENTRDRVRHCAQLAAGLPDNLDNRDVAYCARTGRVVLVPPDVIRPNGDRIPSGFASRLHGTDWPTCRPDETSLILLNDLDLAAIHRGEWEAPALGSRDWYERIAAQFEAGRQARYQAEIAKINTNRPAWETAGIAWAWPSPPQPLAPYDPGRRMTDGADPDWIPAT